MDCKWCKKKQILRRKGVKNYFFWMISYIFTHVLNKKYYIKWFKVLTLVVFSIYDYAPYNFFTFHMRKSNY